MSVLGPDREWGVMAWLDPVVRGDSETREAGVTPSGIYDEGRKKERKEMEKKG